MCVEHYFCSLARAIRGNLVHRFCAQPPTSAHSPTLGSKLDNLRQQKFALECKVRTRSKTNPQRDANYDPLHQVEDLQGEIRAATEALAEYKDSKVGTTSTFIRPWMVVANLDWQNFKIAGVMPH